MKKKIRTILFGLVCMFACAACGNAEKKELYMHPLEGEQAELARKLTKTCVVRLDVAGIDREYYGSGIIWDVTEEKLIVVTAGHLLELGEVSRVVFADGSLIDSETAAGMESEKDQKTQTEENRNRENRNRESRDRESKDRDNKNAEKIKTLGISQIPDIGFLEVDVPSVEGGGMAVSLHQRIFDTLDSFSALYINASTPEGAADQTIDVFLLEKESYQETFGTETMLLSGEAGEGTSGAGVFDGYGNLIGMVVGGNGVQIAAVSMEQINEVYEEVTGLRRKTENY